MTAFLKATKAAGLNGAPGKQAIKNKYKGQISASNKKVKFSGSVDLDAQFEAAQPNSNRWDYGVGFRVGGKEFAIWIEPHSASGPGEVAVMLKKLKWLQAKLKTLAFKDLDDLTEAAKAKEEFPFRWLYSGRLGFRRNSPEARQLVQNGMKLPERKIKVG